MGDECCSTEGKDNKEHCCKAPEPYDEMTWMMMKLADQAWSDLMRKKIAKVFEERNGAKQDATAKIVADHVIKVWDDRMTSGDHHKMPTKEEVETFRNKFFEAMHG